MTMQRREFISLLGKAAGLGLWPWPALAGPGEVSRLVVVFLRGGLDGLAALPPLADPFFRLARPDISLPPAGSEGAALALGDTIGLHPSLASLQDFWNQGALTFVPACTSPLAARAHREAQEFMETALSLGRGGWLSRLLAELRRGDPEASAVSFCPSTPAVLSGKLKTQNVQTSSQKLDPPSAPKSDVSQALERLYSGDRLLSKVYAQAVKDRGQAVAALTREASLADCASPLASRFPELVMELAKLMQNPKAPRLAFFSLGGFDTHISQGTNQGPLADSLRSLGDGLAILAKTLGPAFENTVVVVLSEFGRTLLENDYQGTDHARAGLLWLLGPKVAGGKIANAWPKFDQSYLLGREIEPFCDFRDVLWPVLAKHFSLPQEALARIFPAFNPGRNLGDLLR